jgi:NAD(P)H-nitrite reductase large subunit
MSKTVVIAGAGHGAGQVVAALKQHEFDGRIVMIGDEPYLPYQRPPLSKKYLAGDMAPERLYFKPESFYDDPQIEVLLNTCWRWARESARYRSRGPTCPASTTCAASPTSMRSARIC